MAQWRNLLFTPRGVCDVLGKKKEGKKAGQAIGSKSEDEKWKDSEGEKPFQNDSRPSPTKVIV